MTNNQVSNALEGEDVTTLIDNADSFSASESTVVTGHQGDSTMTDLPKCSPLALVPSSTTRSSPAPPEKNLAGGLSLARKESSEPNLEPSSMSASHDNGLSRRLEKMPLKEEEPNGSSQAEVDESMPSIGSLLSRKSNQDDKGSFVPEIQTASVPRNSKTETPSADISCINRSCVENSNQGAGSTRIRIGGGIRKRIPNKKIISNSKRSKQKLAKLVKCNFPGCSIVCSSKWGLLDHKRREHMSIMTPRPLEAYYAKLAEDKQRN